MRSEFSEELILVSDEKLSADELETLKEATDVLIDEHINRLKERGVSTD